MASVQSKDNKSNSDSLVLIPDDADHSILQQPLNHGIKNVKQILKCIESGSREVKDIILNECNIIYECKVCLGLFRSLANLVFHKRGFCKAHLCENMLLFESFNETTEPECEVVQPQPVEDEKLRNVPMDTEQTAKVTKDKTSEDNILLNGDENVVTLSDDSEKAMDEESMKVDDDDGDSEKAIADESEKVNEVCVKGTDKPEKSISSDRQATSDDDEVIVIDDDSEKEEVKNPVIGKKNKRSSVDDDHEGSDVEVITLPAENSKKNLNESDAQVEENNANDQKKKPKPNVIPIILKPIVGNQNAVFQVLNKDTLKPCTLKVENASESGVQLSSNQGEQKKVIIVVPNKQAMSPVKKHVNESPTANNSPETPKDLHLTRRKRLLNRSDCNVQSLKCLKCSTHFTTLKTLYFHMMSFHSQKRMYFPCPFSKSLFVQMYGVTRHLIQVHGKTKEQINNKMRDAIRKTAVWKRVTHASEDSPETPEKENEREEKPLKEKRDDSSEKKKLNDSQSSEPKIRHSYVKVENNVPVHHCSKCQRVFTRKSSQVSHEKFCIMNSPTKSENSGYSTTSESPSPTKSEPLEMEKKSPIEFKPSIRPKRGAEKQMHKDFVDSQTLKWRSANRIETASASSPSSTGSTPTKKKASKAYEKKILSLVNSEKLLCLKCDRKFSSFSNLRRHAAIHIGWTRFKCRCCEYQSYNKSDIIHHVLRMHTPVSEEDLPKYVINLLSEHQLNKVCSPKSIKPQKPSSSDSKKNLSVRRKKTIAKQLDEKKKLQSKQKVSRLEGKVLFAKSTPDSKKKKSVKSSIQSKYVSNSAKKAPNSYKSVTTNSPTTIILSKTNSNSVGQTTTNTTSSAASSVSSSSEKSSPIRISPRKFETGLKVIRSPTASGYETAAVMHRKSSIVKIKVSAESNFSPSGASPDKTLAKKNRTISDWFTKKASPVSSSAVPRREAGPVIIDLIPSRSKNSAPSVK